MRRVRILIAIAIVVVMDAVIAFNVPALRDRLADPVTRLATYALVDVFATRGTWTEGRAAPTPKMEAPSAALDGKLYVFGGFAGTGYGAPVEPRVSVYDPATDQWSRAADLPLDVTHCNTVLVDGTVWLAGGYRGPHPGTVVADVLRYDVAANAWSRGPSLPVATAAGTLALIGRTLHYVGGFRDRDTTVGEHWALALDGGPSTWQPRAPLPVPRGHLASAVVDGRLYAIGGQIRHDTDPVDLAAVHVYDADRDAWSAAAALPGPRSHFESSTFVHDGHIVIVGGRDNTRIYPVSRAGLANVTRYDPRTDTWTELPTLPIGLESTSARVIDGRLIVTNGSTMGSIRGQTRTFLARFP
jgi:N-acetylneuraminic acid mutarotase